MGVSPNEQKAKDQLAKKSKDTKTETKDTKTETKDTKTKTKDATWADIDNTKQVIIKDKNGKKFEYKTYYDDEKGVGISSSKYFVELQFFSIFEIGSFNILDAMQVGGLIKIGKNAFDPLVNIGKSILGKSINSNDWGSYTKDAQNKKENVFLAGELAEGKKDYGVVDKAIDTVGSMIVGIAEILGNLVRVDTKERLTNYIILPLPTTLPSENFTINWQNEDLGIFGALQNRRTTSGEFGGPPIGILLKPISDFMISSVTGANSEEGVIASLGTQYLNFEKFRRTQMGIKSGEPNDMLVLDDINRRQITLEWIFIPQSKNEANNLFNILNVMKQNVLPANNRNKYGITYPDFVNIKIKLNNELYYHIKQGVIENLEIDFPKSSEGMWRTDGKPFEISVKMSIQDRYRLYQNTYNDLMGYSSENYFGYSGVANDNINRSGFASSDHDENEK